MQIITHFGRVLKQKKSAAFIAADLVLVLLFGGLEILRTVVKQFADLEQIIGDPGHELSHLLIVKKTKRELLIVLKNLVSHVIFHFGAHDVAIISNEIIAVKFKSNQSQH